MLIAYNNSLKNLNTFRVDVKANKIITISSTKELLTSEVEECFKSKFVIVGQASNILFTKDFSGTVLLINNEGTEMLKEDTENIYIKVQAGEKWDRFVEWSVKNNLIGIQNLADIPGTIGASPVQNIGAYGVELKDVLESVEVFDIQSKKFKQLSNSECDFGYRDSIFKNKLKDRVVITSVTFKLQKYNQYIPERYFEYVGIKDKAINKEKCTLAELFNIVQEIRKEKLPSIKKYGSCGSTFKNPLIYKTDYERLKNIYPELPAYPTEIPNIVKIPAAYILEKLGWKNKRKGNTGTWIYHPLIVTNYGEASASEIYNFITDIQEDFKKNTGINLETEINII